MFSGEFYEISQKPMDGCFCINTFRVFKNNVTPSFRLSIFLAKFENWEQERAQYFKPLSWSLFSTSQTSAMELFLQK